MKPKAASQSGEDFNTIGLAQSVELGTLGFFSDPPTKPLLGVENEVPQPNRLEPCTRREMVAYDVEPSESAADDTL